MDQPEQPASPAPTPPVTDAAAAAGQPSAGTSAASQPGSAAGQQQPPFRPDTATNGAAAPPPQPQPGTSANGLAPAGSLPNGAAAATSEAQQRAAAANMAAGGPFATSAAQQQQPATPPAAPEQGSPVDLAASAADPDATAVAVAALQHAVRMQGGDVAPATTAADVAWPGFEMTSNVQQLLDQNKLLINEINANHEERQPDGLARNQLLIRELNSNIGKVTELYQQIGTSWDQFASSAAVGGAAAPLATLATPTAAALLL